MTAVRLAERPVDELPGAGPLTPLLVDPAVTDVLVNGIDVWLDRGRGLERCGITFGSRAGSPSASPPPAAGASTRAHPS